MRSIPFFVLASLAVPAFADDAAKPVPTLEPDGAWVLDYDDHRCRAARKFKALDGSEPTLFYLEQYVPAAVVDWLVTGGAVTKRRAWDVRFGPRNEPFEVSNEGVSLGEYGRAIMGSGTGKFEYDIEKRTEANQEVIRKRGALELDPETADGIDWLEIEGDSSDAVRIPLDNLPKIYEAMNTCMADLVRSWGYDPAKRAEAVTGTRPLNMHVMAREIIEDYLRQKTKSGNFANFSMRLMVEADGTVSKCVMLAKTVADGFDSSACRTMVKKARFEPAKDAEGNPLPSYYMQELHYRAH